VIGADSQAPVQFRQQHQYRPLVAQMVYYVASSLDVERRTRSKRPTSFGGNLGNAFAAVWLRLGFPIGHRSPAQYQSHRADFLKTGIWQPASVATLASAWMSEPSIWSACGRSIQCREIREQ